MTKITLPRATVEQALKTLEAGTDVDPIFAGETEAALRAALAQQKDPTDPGNDVDVLREHVRHLERRVRQLHAQQDEPLNLADPAVQKRLATQWGYVPAAQAEPVEPVAALIAQRDALLEALKAMLEQFNYHTISGIVHDESSAIDRARAAIRACNP